MDDDVCFLNCVGAFTLYLKQDAVPDYADHRVCYMDAGCGRDRTIPKGVNVETRQDDVLFRPFSLSKGVLLLLFSSLLVQDFGFSISFVSPFPFTSLVPPSFGVFMYPDSRLHYVVLLLSYCFFVTHTRQGKSRMAAKDDQTRKQDS